MMKYVSTLIAVKDIEKSKRFYLDVLGLHIVADFGANVTLEGGIALQTLDTWKTFIRTDQVDLPNNAGELYFEEEDIDAFCDRLQAFELRYVHKLFEHPWGQRVVRFYDPDGHIIEVGETMNAVIRRWIDSGLSAEDTAKRMDVPLEFVLSGLGGDSITVRPLKEEEREAALRLAWKVFAEFESFDYAPEGTAEFLKTLKNEEYLAGIRYYGAWDQERLIGVLGIREETAHVCLFFVDGEYHRRGIGTRLFERMRDDFSGRTMTLNSSPYGLPFYKVLGFTATDREQTVNGIRFTPMAFEAK